MKKSVLLRFYKACEGLRFGSLGNKIRLFFLRRIARSIGTNVFIAPRVTLIHPENLIIGNNVSIRQDTYIDCSAIVQIGNDVSIAHSVSIIAFNHSYEGSGKIRDNEIVSKEITIMDDCWVGCRSVILAGVKLSPRTIVAAGAVVTHTSPGNCIIGGVPAKMIKAI